MNIFEKDNKKFYVREGTLDEYIIKEKNSYFNKINITKKDNWLDLGGNIGMFSVFIADFVNKVITCEPDKTNFEILTKNLELNKINNVISINKAVIENDKKTINFFLNTKKNMGVHSILVKRGRTPITVECININKISEEFNINKIKMDIEGYEYLLIKNMNFKNIKEIILEFHHNILKDKDKKKYKEIINILKNNFSTLVYKEDTKKNWTSMIWGEK